MTQLDEPLAERVIASIESASNDSTSLLLAYLRGRDAPCPVCGYNLRDLTRPVCPECAEPLALAVRAAERPIWPFILAMTPGLFSGVCAVLLALLIAHAVTIGGGLPPVWWLPFVVESIGIASFAVAATLYRRRRAFLLLPGSSQLSWAAAIWIVHIMLFLFVIVLGP
jgi:hypothetical protein